VHHAALRTRTSRACRNMCACFAPTAAKKRGNWTVLLVYVRVVLKRR
jgi:hypothetical protein